jgi:hypothetical protein
LPESINTINQAVQLIESGKKWQAMQVMREAVNALHELKTTF